MSKKLVSLFTVLVFCLAFEAVRSVHIFRLMVSTIYPHGLGEQPLERKSGEYNLNRPGATL